MDDASGARSPKRIRLDDDAAVSTAASVNLAAAGEGKTQKREPRRGRGHGRGRGEYKGKRSREEWTERAKPDGEDSQPSEARLPKRKCAILLGFCGTGYSGMQRQRDVSTIEGVLFDALVKAGSISKDNADDPAKTQLHRAARTDAGVHAAGNVVSVKLITDVPGVPDLVAHLNELLPPSIRVWSILRTLNSFDAKSYCDSRKYTYVFPSHALLPPKPGSALYTSIGSLDHPFWTSILDGDEQSQKEQWRISSDELDAFRATLTCYNGTHNFHNFTVGKEFKDRTTHRFMKSIEVAEPTVHDGVEWISVLFHGQSFMLHQRKMIGAAVLITRTRTPSEIFTGLYGPQKVHIPKAPALGLLLEHPLFESYNARLANAPDRVPLEFAVHKEEMERFKDDKIYSEIWKREREYQVFDKWVRSVDSYNGDDFRWLGQTGKIPDEAVYVRGVRRTNVFIEMKKETGEEGGSDTEDLGTVDLADMEG